ncbi:MAG: DUF6179 domain-containing protein [Lachnospiraceae bacterium]
MEYEIEELLPVVAKLTQKYTSKESSSVSFETAEQLLQAVLYCIESYETERTRMHLTEDRELSTSGTPSCQRAYELGFEAVVAQVHRCRGLYEALLAGFDDYGCHNYRDTILKGMPAFFKFYDVWFHPQNTILTLDYPALYPAGTAQGSNRIEQYLTGILYEKRFLDMFDHDRVCMLLEMIQLEYAELFLDNICAAVLLQAAGCLMAGRSPQQLTLVSADEEAIRAYLGQASKSAIIEKVTELFRTLTAPVRADTVQEYFLESAPGVASRIFHGLTLPTLEGIFLIERYSGC